MANRRRWGDNDHFLGPFTYARNANYRPFALELGSGDGDEYPGCFLRISLVVFTVILALPSILKPHRRRVVSNRINPETRRPQYEFWDLHPRVYGFSYCDGFLQVYYGAQTGDSSTEQCWSTHIPWTQWRFVGERKYGLSGELIKTIDAPKLSLFPKKGSRVRPWSELPTIDPVEHMRTFMFADYDGEILAARTHIEERTWLFGQGWFSWLSWFRKPMVKRSLDISFSSETGSRKGSWKGGTIGHSIDMLLGENHEQAFRRYCAQNKMRFCPVVTTRSDDEVRQTSVVEPVTHDIALGDNTEKILHYLTSVLGFEEVYNDIESAEHPSLTENSIRIYAHRRDGLLLRLDINNPLGTIGTSRLYYNWTPKQLSHGTSLRAVESGHMKDGVWVGNRQGLVGMNRHLSLLRADGTFVTPWIQRPKLGLSHTTRNGVNDILGTVQILHRLPDWVKVFVGTTPTLHVVSDNPFGSSQTPKDPSKFPH